MGHNERNNEKEQPMSDRMARLRSALHAGESPESWQQILDVFEHWPDDDELSVALAYAETHMADWTEDTRIFPVIDPSHPAWSFARQIDHHVSYLEARESQQYIQHLTQLIIRDTGDLLHLPPLASLHTLALEYGDFYDLKGLESYEYLERLWIGQLHNDAPKPYDDEHWQERQHLQDIENLEHLSQLKHLTLAGCFGIQSYDVLSKLKQLESLSLRFSSLHTLPDLSALTNLKHLDLSYTYIESLASIEALTKLESIDVTECRSLTSLKPLSNMEQLQKVSIEGCRSIVSLEGLEHWLPQQTTLSLRRCTRLQDIQLLAQCLDMEHLDLAYTKELNDTRPLLHLHALESLDLRSCPALEISPKRKNMRNRKEVSTYQALLAKAS
jgi:hypothetical protein